MKKKLLNEKGSALIIVIVGMIAILGVASLVIDIGLVVVEKNKLKNTADAAALAGALDLPHSSKSVNTALDYIEKNGFSQDIAQVSVLDGGYAIQVILESDVNYKIARVLGFTDPKIVNVSSKAVIGGASAVYEGIRPFVVEQQQFTYGQQVVLKEDGGDGYHGNYGAAAFGGTGASVFENNIKFGYKGRLKVGDMIDTEPGSMAGPTLDGVDYIINGVEDITLGDYCTFENYTPDSRRLWIIPVVASLCVDGRATVEIVGFALFFLEDANKVSGKAEITGRFIEFVTNGDITPGQTSFGVNGVKLVE